MGVICHCIHCYDQIHSHPAKQQKVLHQRVLTNTSTMNDNSSFLRSFPSIALHILTAHNLVIVKKSSPKNLSANCWLTVGCLLADCWPSVGRLSTDCWPTVGRLSADSRPTDGRQVFSKIQTISRPTDSRQTTDSRPTVGDVSVRCR